MMKKIWITGICLFLVCALMAASASAAAAPAYQDLYGSAPTSAGMMMGFYDLNGYDGLQYGNLVPGGVADLTAGVKENMIIASPGHVGAFYGGGDGKSGDDDPSLHTQFDCLADFMGTSQDSAENVNGETAFYYFSDGSKFTAANALSYGVQDTDGMYGITEYIKYAGYGVAWAFTQLIDASVTSGGFSFEDYRVEIDAGRVVMIQVEGLSLFGYGYDVKNEAGLDIKKVLFHDTMNEADHAIEWGGAYEGMSMWGVTCFELTGGEKALQEVPEPASLILLLSGLMGIMMFKRSRL